MGRVLEHGQCAEPTQKASRPVFGEHPDEWKTFLAVAFDHRLHLRQHDGISAARRPFGHLAMLPRKRYLLPLIQLYDEFLAELFDQIASNGLPGAADAWVKAADLAFPLRLEE